MPEIGDMQVPAGGDAGQDVRLRQMIGASLRLGACGRPIRGRPLGAVSSLRTPVPGTRALLALGPCPTYVSAEIFFRDHRILLLSLPGRPKIAADFALLAR
jgi:hypothetical protein